MPRNVGFYFGSVIFFVGVLLGAVGTSRMIAGSLDFVAFADLIGGVVLIILGFRAIRSVHDGSSAKSSTK